MEQDLTVFDVAQYILKYRPMSHMKLQKLVYYCQAWSLVWDDVPLFKEPIQAWVNGPVCRELYNQLRGRFQVCAGHLHDLGDSCRLTDSQRETVNEVLRFYGDKDAQWLSDLTHMERPWAKARKGLSDDCRTDREITWDSMAEYYSSLRPN